MLDDAILKEVNAKDTFAAIELVSSGPDPLKNTETFGELLHHFNNKKQLHWAIAFGRAGIQYGLAQARAISQSNPELATKLRGAAKPLAYNVASFTWPGWDEPGITISAADLVIGYDAAKANLRLAIELQRGDLPMSRAHWLLGAHELARENRPEARKQFDEAAKRAAAANEKGDELLNVGYRALIDVLDAPDDHGPAEAFAQVQRDLAKLPDGNFFVEQLQTAFKVFKRK
jgi:hypothetical protein